MTKGKSKKASRGSELAPTRTAQHCAQCTAHGKISLLKGHKRECPFKECRCVHCVLVNNKRQIMAKQVKLKRLQEKNHRRMGRKTSPFYQPNIGNPSLLNNNSDAMDVQINEIQRYQDDAWHAICGPSDDMDQPLPTCLPPKYLPLEQWSPTMLPFPQFNPLQQLQSNITTASLFSPCPVVTTTALSFFTTPIGEPEAPTSINHVLTQPVFYPPPSFGQNMLALPSPFPTGFFEENATKVVEVETGESGSMPSIDAAEALLTLQTGEE